MTHSCLPDLHPVPAPRLPLLSQPTPLQRLVHLEQALDRPGLYMKRDDHMELAMGGNKLRSLEFWLGAARAEGADTVLVAGGPMSNLCRLTAAAASVHGFDCVVLHNGEDSPAHRATSFLNRLFGAQVRFLGAIDERQRQAAVVQAASDLAARGRRPYIVGDAVVGALGYVVAAHELHRQVREQAAALRHVFLPGSMGTTEAGFIFGNAMLGCPFDIHLVSVEYSQMELAARLSHIYDGLRQAMGCAVPPLHELPVHYHMEFLGDGYARTTAAAQQAILRLARVEGILLEHVYTAKTCAAFLDLAQRGALEQGGCVIHTGGTASLFAQFDWFEAMW